MLSRWKRTVFLSGLAAGIIFLLIAWTAFSLSGTKFGSSLLFIGMGCGLGWGLTWLFTRWTIVKPLAQLAAAGEDLVAKDSLASPMRSQPWHRAI